MTNKLQQIANNTSNTVNTTVNKNGNNESQLIKAQIMAVVSSFEIIDKEREHQKEVLEKLEADHGITKKVAKKVAKLVHKQNKKEVDDEFAEVDNLHSKLFKQS